MLSHYSVKKPYTVLVAVVLVLVLGVVSFYGNDHRPAAKH